MSRTSRMATVVRLIAAATLVGVGLLYTLSAAFHWWSSWGPPTPHPELEVRTAVRHIGYAFVLMLGGFWVLKAVLRDARHRTRHCAGREGFEAVRYLVTRAGLTIEEAEYRHLSFGSWVIRVTHVPPLRLVWDGKDGWAYLEVETADLHQGMPIWRDIWLGRHKAEQRAVDVVKVLVEEVRRAPVP